MTSGKNPILIVVAFVLMAAFGYVLYDAVVLNRSLSVSAGTQ
jgi:hypothetical protein